MSKKLACYGVTGLVLLFLTNGVMAATPPIPTLKSPSSGATVSCTNATFSWNSSVGATSYSLLIGRDSTFSGVNNGGSACINDTCAVFNVGNITTYSKPMSFCGTTYFWKVRANNASGGSAWSNPTWSFKSDGVAASLPAVDWTSAAYRSSNLFWKAKYAPKRFYANNLSLLGNAKGNCTWYAHGRLRQIGYSVNLDRMSGNAKTWNAAAKAAGILVDTTPTPGAIAQSTVGTYGHVAVVEKVNTDGTIVISESSYAPGTPSWDFEYRTRTVNKTTFNNYIHVK